MFIPTKENEKPSIALRCSSRELRQKMQRTARYNWAGLKVPEISTKGTPIYSQDTGKEVKRAQRN